ncbi:MAG: hypothetical protein H7257_00715 [Taibaiella sp.]|nr:hypothetical protein [Taibaiella sp.]
MFSTIFFFEIKRLFNSLSTYIYFLILFAVSFFMALFIGGAFKDIKVNTAGEKIFANSPTVIDGFFSSINGWVGAIIVVAVIGNAVLKDFRYNTHNLIFTTPVSKFSYLFGRFAGAVFVSLLILTGPAIGMMAAFATPWVSPARIEAFMLLPYLQCYWQTIIPNAILQGAIFFAVSLIARDIFIIWLSLLLLWIGMGVSNSLFSSLQYETIASLADPLGTHAKRAISKYWSTYDKNHLVYQMTGLFLWNRLLWLAVAASVFITGYLSFSFSSLPKRLSFGKPKLREQQGNVLNIPLAQKITLPTARQSYTTATNLGNLWGLAVNECRTLLRNTYFRIILLFGMLFLFLASMQLGKIYDTTTLPVTYQVIETFGGAFQLFIIILTVIFGGEIVWRARENRMDNILDALPVPNWVFYVSKLTGLLFMQLLLILVIMVSGIIVQLFNGYTHVEILLYIKYLFAFKLIDLWLLAVLCVFVHTLVRNKFVGYFIVVLFYAWNTFFASLVLKHNLLIFASDPGVIYSDMNGFGNFVFPYFIFKIYWGAFAFCLAVLSSLLWARGADNRLKWRIAQAGKAERRRTMVVLGAGMLVFIGCGSFIYYNTNIDHKFLTSFKAEELAATYEKKYKKYERTPQPKITDVVLKIDIFPERQGLHAAGSFVLQNKTGKAVDSIHINYPDGIDIHRLTFSQAATLVMNDSDYDYRIYKLDRPLQPGDTLTMAFEIDKSTHGFTHESGGLSSPLYNGTFLNNENFLPSIGYSVTAELQDNAQRKKHGLGYRATSNPINDTTQYNNNVFSRDADFISFDATVSTVPDQVAIAPGYLQKEWLANGRKYFHYKMDTKILNFYSFLSARYKVKKDKWNNTDIEIYYHEGHEYNLDRMISSIKKSLAYYSSNFSAYQHKQVRILEFPRYSTFAQSFPNTIPFSEGIGFIAKVDDSSKDDLDYVFYVTAHEVAHQWWAHQVVGANVEGSNMLSESLAQYASITVMEKQYGDEKIRKFLHIEMDNYLTARSNESEKEKPLAYVDAGQGYILYQKGGIIMTALRKYVGEDSINHALSSFINQYALKAPPYPTTLDLIKCLRQVTPDSLQYLITDGFQKIILYDNEVTAISSAKNGDAYNVNFTLNIKKLSADSAGKETEITCNDYIDIAVYKDRNNIEQITRLKIKNGKTSFTLPSKSKPYKVVIDPNNLLIDKKPGNNEMKITTEDKIAKK